VIAVQALTPASPTDARPSLGQASLIGAWRGFVSSKAVRAGSDTTVGFALSCSQTWEITAQSDGRFEGQMSSSGSGPESDWRCTQSRRFAGEVTPDDRVTISFVPEFKVGGCASAAGGGTATGSLSAGSIVVALPYRATCEMTPVVGPSLDLEIAATITLTPR
jgi:hypothetical protein